jgi:hypothetical protein
MLVTQDPLQTRHGGSLSPYRWAQLVRAILRWYSAVGCKARGVVCDDKTYPPQARQSWFSWLSSCRLQAAP